MKGKIPNCVHPHTNNLDGQFNKNEVVKPRLMFKQNCCYIIFVVFSNFIVFLFFFFFFSYFRSCSTLNHLNLTIQLAAQKQSRGLAWKLLYFQVHSQYFLNSIYCDENLVPFNSLLVTQLICDVLNRMSWHTGHPPHQ